MKNLIFCCLLFLLADCTSGAQTIFKDRKNEIVLINSQGEKCELAKLIELLNQYQPKVIGVNLLLNADSNSSCTNRLLAGLEKSNQVVLIEGIYDKLSDEAFYGKVFDAGETGLVRYDSRVTIESYYRLAEYKMRRSFPFLIAVQYDTSKELQLMLKTRRGQYPLISHNKLSDFKTLEISTIEENLVKDKIVLIGHLDSIASNMCLTRFSDNTSRIMNRTVVEANVILSILRDLDTLDEKPNKYTEFILREGKKKRK